MSDDANVTHGAPSWIEHHGADPVAARKFYAGVLDWNVVDMPVGDGGSYPGIMIGEKPVGGFSPRPKSDSGWLVYITVDDVDKRFNAAIAAGATALSEPVDAPGVGRIATLKDPFGGEIAFIKYAA